MYLHILTSMTFAHTKSYRTLTPTLPCKGPPFNHLSFLTSHKKGEIEHHSNSSEIHGSNFICEVFYFIYLCFFPGYNFGLFIHVISLSRFESSFMPVYMYIEIFR